ncbi:MAG TPA: molybdopterin molybdotransferase MoeA [Beijerinckiaceae bacterium]|nr:molybdopterin molybdotransferase MoeA [Beijerinckiaceae bacterium]
MAGAPLLPVEEALRRVLDGVRTLESETVALTAAGGRTLASDLAARRTQPPWANSAMDGYAVRAADTPAGAVLTLIGESAAGQAFAGAIGPGQTVRIFTGAPIPDGADAILIQENASAEGARITVAESVRPGQFVRTAGLDFAAGQTLLKAGTRLGPTEVALAAAMNHAVVPVVRRPRVAVLATGDELVLPGENPGQDQIVASNNFAIAAAAEAYGAEAHLLGIATDDFASLEAAIGRARDLKADVLVTIGGASVGDHDLVQSALAKDGMTLGFWRIAMRPGKPLIFGSLGSMRILGLPGNPVSSIVCTIVFIRPLIRALLGDPGAGIDPSEAAILGADMKENDLRQDYVRSRITGRQRGLPVVEPHPVQDSSMLAVLAASQALTIRAPFAPAAKAGETCRMIPLRLLTA